jgi:amino acid transporter
MDTKDSELGRAVTTSEGEIIVGSTGHHLKRDFKPRQVNMLAIAGAIGTGLIIGSGQGLTRGGPGSLFIAYSITGAIIYFVMTALGEMSSFLPMDQGFSGYAERFVDPALGSVNYPHLI